jgi:hypothetical protein
MAHVNEQTLIPDPNFPLIQLPGEYDSHRSTNCLQLSEGEAYNLIDAEGPGCVRHFWITTSGTSELEIEIICDGVQQIQMMMHQFFGVLLGKEFYRIESAAINLLPQNGYNSYFPIPFQSSCRIILRNTDSNTASIWSMVNWQKAARETGCPRTPATAQPDSLPRHLGGQRARPRPDCAGRR